MERPDMNITILDDYQDTIRTLACYPKVAGHMVTIWNDHTKDVDTLAARLKDTEALVLIRERTPIRAPVLERLPKLRLISQAGVFPHIDVEACTRRGVLVCSTTGPGRPSYATAELTWGFVIAAFRRIPQEMHALRAGKWQAYPIGIGLRGKTLGIYGYGKIGAVVAGYGKAFGMNVLAWGRENSVTHARAAGRRRGARGRGGQGGPVRRVGRAVAAPAADRRHARHRHRRRSGAHEAERPYRQHEPRRADRARGARGGAARRPAGHGGRRRLRGRAGARRQASAALHGQRDLRPAPGLRRARRARAHAVGHLRSDPSVRER